MSLSASWKRPSSRSSWGRSPMVRSVSWRSTSCILLRLHLQKLGQKRLCLRHVSGPDVGHREVVLRLQRPHVLRPHRPPLRPGGAARAGAPPGTCRGSSGCSPAPRRWPRSGCPPPELPLLDGPELTRADSAASGAPARLSPGYRDAEHRVERIQALRTEHAAAGLERAAEELLGLGKAPGHALSPGEAWRTDSRVSGSSGPRAALRRLTARWKCFAASRGRPRLTYTLPRVVCSLPASARLHRGVGLQRPRGTLEDLVVQEAHGGLGRVHAGEGRVQRGQRRSRRAGAARRAA